MIQDWHIIWATLGGLYALFAWLTWKFLNRKRIRKNMQFEIDSLMLEYCPDEMTDEQRENWGKHQVPADQ